MAGRTSDTDALIVAGVDMIFNREMANETRMYYPEICTEVRQEKKVGNYQQIGAIGPAEEKPEGDEFALEGLSDYYTTNITSVTYGKGVKASMEQIEYDLYGVVRRLFGAPMKRTLVINRERLVADEYNGAFDTTGADGVYLASASHPLENSSLTNDNLASGALTPENLKDALNKFNSIYDQAGEFFDTSATDILIHPNKLFLLMELLQSQQMAFELSNTKNSLADVPLRIVVDKYLDYSSEGVSPWFLIDKTLYGMDGAGVVLQRKSDPEVNLWWHNESLEYRGSAHEMFGVGTVAPGYGYVASPGS